MHPPAHAQHEPPVVPCVGAIVHDTAGRLLLIQRGQEPHAGSWSLPGGRIELGETAEQAVQREVAEETGLSVRAGAVAGRVRIPAVGVVYDVLDFVCTMEHPTQVPTAGDDASDVAFVDAAALRRLTCTPGLIETLRDWAALPR